ncbi:methyltransferase domain-containing protein [Patescibacteria group bacterium]|nr:methyltransferase domain-containing protein [Patescibacteria group bacterium]
MNKYLFFLGHQPKISIAEIKAVFSCLQINAKTEQQNNTFFIAETKNELDYKNLINTLGGTIKIAEKISENNITDFLAKTPEEFKIQFSLSGPNSKKIAMAVKKQLKAMGRSVRYVEPKNTATILHNKLVKKQGDLTIFQDEIFVTRAIQPFEEFGERDYNRPGADSFSGMLPPKLARIMINLGMSCLPLPEGESTRSDGGGGSITLLDPFCGSGTILTEALDLGFKNLIGSDISEKAITDTDENIKWLQNSYKLSAISHKLYTTDATELSKHIKPKSVDLIVSEPYLGKPLRGNERRDTLQKQTNDLAELYVSAFKQFHKILKKDGVAIFIIPKFKCENNWVEIDCTEKIKKTGFKIIPLSEESDSLTYHRPKQHVARVIWGFKKA